MSFELKKIEMSEDEFKKQNQSEDFGEILEVFEDDELKETEIDPDACIKEVKTKSHKNNSAVKQKSKSKDAYMEKTLQGDFVRQTYIITDDIKWALKRKAAFEKREVNVVLREILSREIEGKYFD